MIRITYVGHATVEIDTGGTRLLTDPVVRGRVAHLRRIVPLPPLPELARPDAVLISHAHFDHLDLPSLRRLASCPVLAPRGCGRLLERAGLREVTELAPGQRLRVGATEVTAALMDHNGRRHPFSRARETLAYLLHGPGRVFFAGDTDLFDRMRAFAGGLDVALLPIWGWGPRLPRGHMGPPQAARAAALLEPRVAIPIHWGTLASPRAGWLDDPARPARAFERHVAELAPDIEVRVLAPGGRTEIARPAAASEPE
jgi:L-ascorbate metabolism protein UlaG (beta-lactamase superfamily)